MSIRYNAIFDTGHLIVGMIQAAIYNRNVGGCTNSRKIGQDSIVPTDMWYASKLKSAYSPIIQNAFDSQVNNQIMTKSIKRISQRPVLAIDMRLIEYYGEKARL